MRLWLLLVQSCWLLLLLRRCLPVVLLCGAQRYAPCAARAATRASVWHSSHCAKAALARFE